MGKSDRKSKDKAAKPVAAGKTFIKVDKKAIDTKLDSLFATSLGPVQPPPKSRYQNKKQPAEEPSEEGAQDEDDEVLSSASEELDSEDDAEDAMDVDGDSEEEDSVDEDEDSAPEEASPEPETVLAKAVEAQISGESDKPNKKRKRNKEDELEDVYMRKLAREELKEEEERKKKQKTEADGDAATASEDSDDESDAIPKHETQMESQDKTELEKAARTVFLGNVSSEAITSKSAKKTLLRHLASFIEDLADSNPPHKVESLRFRSTAFGTVLPKKAAFAKKEILDATTKSTNAYAVYSTQVAAREAAKRLNGTMVLNRHLRVDSVAHPAKVDHRRCVFVGNLGFVDDESTATTEDGEKKKSNKPPGDVEEGLWVHFSKAGKVESVRVVRDSKTRVGKGFAYVQFEDENGVEAALQYSDQKFPPLLPRKLRVVRAKAPKKKDNKPAQSAKPKGVYTAKVTDEQKTNQGRAQAMLGKAGASKAKEGFVFEGHRASSKQGNSGLKLGGKRKGKGSKPSNRSTKRAAAWKSAGGKAQFNKK